MSAGERDWDDRRSVTGDGFRVADERSDEGDFRIGSVCEIADGTIEISAKTSLRRPSVHPFPPLNRLTNNARITRLFVTRRGPSDGAAVVGAVQSLVRKGPETGDRPDVGMGARVDARLLDVPRSNLQVLLGRDKTTRWRSGTSGESATRVRPVAFLLTRAATVDLPLLSCPPWAGHRGG